MKKRVDILQRGGADGLQVCGLEQVRRRDSNQGAAHNTDTQRETDRGGQETGDKDTRNTRNTWRHGRDHDIKT